MRYQIIKVRNGLWEVHWENGAVSKHSSEKGALRATLLPDSVHGAPTTLPTVEEVVEEFQENYFIGGGAIAYVGHNGDAIDDWLTTTLTTAIAAAEERAYIKGYIKGFRRSGEGFNGEYFYPYREHELDIELAGYACKELSTPPPTSNQ